MRIVSLCPSNTELLAYLGIVDQLVGVDDYSDWPNDINHLPRLGPDLNIDMEKVKGLKPDLILASLSVPGMEKNIEELKRFGLPYIILNPQTLEDIGQDLLTVGELVGIKEHANNVYEQYHAFIHQYKRWSSGFDHRPSVYWEWWPKPIFTPGGGNWLTEISELAGAKNVFAKYKKPSVQTNWETVVAANPDHICLVWTGVKSEKVKPSFVTQREGADSLKAVQNNAIHVLKEEDFCRPSPRLLIGLKKLQSLLYPNEELASQELSHAERL